MGKLGAYTYRAIVEDWAGANTAARKTQASLFDGTVAGEPEEAQPPPSVAALKEAARQADEARVDAALRQLDERIDGLDAEARKILDAEAGRRPARPGLQRVARHRAVGRGRAYRGPGASPHRRAPARPTGRHGRLD